MFGRNKPIKVRKSVWHPSKWKIVEETFWGDEDVDGLPLYDTYDEALKVARDLADLRRRSK